MKTRLFIFTALAAAMAPAQAQRLPAVSFDAYGYSVSPSTDPECAHQYIDLTGTGTALMLVASGTVPAGDDGGAELALAEPFEFYGVPAQRLVASSNGYLAPGVGLEHEDGGYWRNDCPLPAIPDNVRASYARIYALGHDLDQAGSGQLLWRHFEVCPRASGVIDDEACTVVEWHDWRRLDSAERLDFQVVLYHQSAAIALQYAASSGALPDDATVGLQDAGAVSAAMASCGLSGPPAAVASVCFFDPRFPPVGNNDILFRNGFESEP